MGFASSCTVFKSQILTDGRTWVIFSILGMNSYFIMLIIGNSFEQSSLLYHVGWEQNKIFFYNIFELDHFEVLCS
ncbi:hypothetical protein BVRB_7g171080 [Beta vulgaris subsp. vulgaris]|nr:hypothetical protein BVRB_7g171080 [Beta vulgaris subsp. vulgaris]